jgi:hypothetical protein
MERPYSDTFCGFLKSAKRTAGGGTGVVAESGGRGEAATGGAASRNGDA